MNEKISIELNLNEVNTILSALGNEQYVSVFELIQKIQQQAQGQVSGLENTAE